jgi:hypothetical protein
MMQSAARQWLGYVLAGWTWWRVRSCGLLVWMYQRLMR